jgi:hypothetical protein
MWKNKTVLYSHGISTLDSIDVVEFKEFHNEAVREYRREKWIQYIRRLF